MANTCELLINVVRTNKPKMLTGLNQKVRGRVQGLLLSSTQTQAPPADRQRPNPSVVQYAEHGKPVVLPDGESEPQGVPMGLRVEEEGESEGRPVMGRIGVAQRATSPHAKAGRLPSGLSSRESLANRLRRQSR